MHQKMHPFVLNKKDSKDFLIVDQDKKYHYVVGRDLKSLPITFTYDEDYDCRCSLITLIRFLKLTKKHITTRVCENTGRVKPSNIFYRDFIKIAETDELFRIKINDVYFNIYDFITSFYRDYHNIDDIEFPISIPFQYKLEIKRGQILVSHILTKNNLNLDSIQNISCYTGNVNNKVPYMHKFDIESFKKIIPYRFKDLTRFSNDCCQLFRITQLNPELEYLSVRIPTNPLFNTHISPFLLLGDENAFEVLGL
jgi:hypothetical protein